MNGKPEHERLPANNDNSVTPWVVNMGYQNAFILGAFAGLAHTLTIFPIIRWGRYLRQRSADRYWSYVRRGADLDINH